MTLKMTLKIGELAAIRLISISFHPKSDA